MHIQLDDLCQERKPGTITLDSLELLDPATALRHALDCPSILQTSRMLANGGMMKDIVITDVFGGDPDDALNVMLSAMHTNRLGLVVNESSATQKAQLLRSFLGAVGDVSVPVAVSQGTSDASDHENGEVDMLLERYKSLDFVGPQIDLPSDQLFDDVFGKASGRSISIAIISSPKPLVHWLQKSELNRRLFLNAIAKVGIQGGVLSYFDGEEHKLVTAGEEGMLMPDGSQNLNYGYDGKRSSQWLFQFLQFYGVPCIFFSAHAAQEVAFGPDSYERFIRSGNPVAPLFADIAKIELWDLLRRCRMNAEDPARRDLVARCNEEWFAGKFQIQDTEFLKTVSKPEELWNLNPRLSFYDPLLWFFLQERHRNRFTTPYYHTVRGVEHVIIGPWKGSQCIRDPLALKEAIEKGIEQSLTRSASQAELLMNRNG